MSILRVGYCGIRRKLLLRDTASYHYFYKTNCEDALKLTNKKRSKKISCSNFTQEINIF